MPQQYDATLSVMRAAETPLSAAATATRTFGGAVRSAAQSAAGASGSGPLAGALASYGTQIGTGAESLASVVDELRQALAASAEQYRNDDAGAARGSDGVDFTVQTP